MKKEEKNADLLIRDEENPFPPASKQPIFQMIIVACQRHKQLNNGAVPRIEVPSLKTKKTKIAIEEVNQGLIGFDFTN